MRVALRPELTRKLVAMPESGMGYQLIDLILGDGRKIEHVLVFNAQEVEVPEDLLRGTEIIDVRLS